MTSGPGRWQMTTRALRIITGLTVITAACHKHVPARNDRVETVRKDTATLVPPRRDTSRVVPPLSNASVAAYFRDTTVDNAFSTEGQTFKPKIAAQRQSLNTLIRKERERWRATKPGQYRFLLRVDCFCPGVRGWLLIEVRKNRPLIAWDKTGQSVTTTDWNTISIDTLYDNLERYADGSVEVQIAFDPRWHFPRYVRTSAGMPDTWSITQARALKPL